MTRTAKTFRSDLFVSVTSVVNELDPIEGQILPPSGLNPPLAALRVGRSPGNLSLLFDDPTDLRRLAATATALATELAASNGPAE